MLFIFQSRNEKIIEKEERISGYEGVEQEESECGNESLLEESLWWREPSGPCLYQCERSVCDAVNNFAWC